MAEEGDALRELAPSPVEEDWPDLETGEYYSSRQHDKKPASWWSAGALGLSGFSWDRWLLSMQRYSTYAPTAFLGLHFANTSLIPLATRSISESDSYLLLTREIYQAPGLEHTLLTIPVVIHILSGVTLRLIRRRRRARQYGAETRKERKEVLRATLPTSLQARLGYILTPFLGLHVLVNRITPLHVDGGSSSVGLGYVAHGVRQSPWLMGLYYTTFVGAAVWHFVGGSATYMGYKGVTEWFKKVRRTGGATDGYLGSAAGVHQYSKREKHWWIATGIAAAITTTWLAGLSVISSSKGGLAWEVAEWNKLYRSIPWIGNYLVTQ